MSELAHQDALLVAPAPAHRQVHVPGVAQPVARVLLDSPLPHLDRLFDYLVPPDLDEAAREGTRVVVRFGGSEVFGWVWERASSTSHGRRLTPLRRVVSDLVVLPSRTRLLIEAVAERGAGARADVVRLAVPPRHARAEREVRERPQPRPEEYAADVTSQAWRAYDGGAQFIEALASGGSPRAVWEALPAREGQVAGWTEALAEAARACLASGRGVLVVVATTALAEQVAAHLAASLGEEPVEVLSAEHGPARRYRAFTAVVTGRCRVVVGTRAAAFAPVEDLGLAVMWDDGDNRLDEPHAPYVHARTVLALRASVHGAGLLLAGWTRSVEAHAYVEAGWAGQLVAPRPLVREVLARVQVPGAAELDAEGGSGRARIPSLAHRLVRRALRLGPVLVQVPRGGYAPVVACQECRQPARCGQCGGPVGMGRDGQVRCRWCGRGTAWRCEHCGSQRVRMVAVGSVRTADELGRAFPGVPVVVSGAREDHGVVEQVDASARLVVATPGAEPVAEGGYRAVLLLDGAVLSARPELGAANEAMRRWAGAVALARGDAEVMLLGGADPVVAQALVRWDHAGLARRELAERAELRLPPAVRCARVDGQSRAVAELAEYARAQGWDVLGPVPVPGGAVSGARAEDGGAAGRGTAPEPGGAAGGAGGAGARGAAGARARALLRVPRAQGAQLAQWLRVRARERSARREEAVRVELDPTVLW